jgi:hypothetical protein
MNSIKTLFVGAAGVALLQSAHAQTVIHIAGSNGDRAATTQAIQNLLTGTVTFAGISSPATASNYSTFTGGSFNGTPVTIKTAFLGATGGIKAVAGSELVRFLPNGATGTANANPLTATNASQYEEAVPDFTTSTNFQSTSPYQDTYNGHFYIALSDTITGVLPLNFVGSKNFPTDNLTTAGAQALYLRGAIPLAFLTGNSADHNKTLFALGRNTDAGQRYGAMAEIGLGINTPVKQYQPTISSGVATSQALWPRETISGVDSQFTGNSGYNSGANLVAGLVVTLGPTAYQVGNSSATAGYYVGYLTPGDATTAVAGGAVVLKYNGVAYTAAAVQEGQYTPWLYTHVLYDPDLAGTPRDLADAIAAEVTANTIVTPGGGIKLSTMQVRRNAEGALITAKYF